MSIRTDRYRLIQHAKGQLELYDHEIDPAEGNNLAGDPASLAVLQQLRRALEDGWRKAMPKPWDP